MNNINSCLYNDKEMMVLYTFGVSCWIICESLNGGTDASGPVMNLRKFNKLCDFERVVEELCGVVNICHLREESIICCCLLWTVKFPY